MSATDYQKWVYLRKAAGGKLGSKVRWGKKARKVIKPHKSRWTGVSKTKRSKAMSEMAHKRWHKPTLKNTLAHAN